MGHTGFIFSLMKILHTGSRVAMSLWNPVKGEQVFSFPFIPAPQESAVSCSVALFGRDKLGYGENKVVLISISLVVRDDGYF